jgi:hypothetical protein
MVSIVPGDTLIVQYLVPAQPPLAMCAVPRFSTPASTQAQDVDQSKPAGHGPLQDLGRGRSGP